MRSPRVRVFWHLARYLPLAAGVVGLAHLTLAEDVIDTTAVLVLLVASGGLHFMLRKGRP